MGAGQDWFKCELDQATLGALSRRSNRRGMARFGAFFAILGALGAALVWTWGSAWAVPALLAYSAVWSFANAAGHEACHGTPFRSLALNRSLLYATSWMMSWEPVSVKWIHARHHSHTSELGEDAEYLLPNPIKWRDLLSLASGWNQAWGYNKELVLLALGKMAPLMRKAVPPPDAPKVFRNARVFLASYAAIVGASVWTMSWLPVCLLLLPRVIGEPAHGVLRITQHGALATGVKDHRFTTRTMRVNPALGFFYCNMNYHIEHHMFPSVPFHALGQLHEQVKAQMPVPSRGVFGALGEVLATKRRQQADPTHVFQPLFPGAALRVAPS